MKKIILKINNMVCEGCERRICNCLERMDGIEKVEADHKTKLVTISCTEEVDSLQIKKRLEDLDFEVTEEV